MRRRLLGGIVTAVGAATAVTAFGAPALAADGDRGVTIEEFVCFRSVGERIALGRGLAISLPTGRTILLCLPGRP